MDAPSSTVTLPEKFNPAAIHFLRADKGVSFTSKIVYLRFLANSKIAWFSSPLQIIILHPERLEILAASSLVIIPPEENL